MTKPATRPKSSLDDAFYIQPPITVKPDAWCEQNRIIPSAFAKPGKFKVHQYEIQRGPLLATVEPGVRKISLMMAPQLSKTETLLTTAAYAIASDPTSILWLLPTEGIARAFVKERLNFMLRQTPVLGFRSGRQFGNDAVDYKAFPNGSTIAVAYAGSPSQVAMRPARLVIIDEADRLPVLDEGDPMALAHQRASTFRNRLVLQASSPTWSATSRISQEYLNSDQRKAFVACPHCGEWTTLEFFGKKPYKSATVEWGKDEAGRRLPTSARLYCGFCSGEWSEVDRLKAITSPHAIRWHQCKPFECCDVFQEPLKTRKWDWDEDSQCGRALCTECGQRAVSNESVGFQASKLYSQDLSVVGMARAWIEAVEEGAPEAQTEFMNLFLAEAADPTEYGKVADAHELMQRREDYKNVPREVVMLTVGCDVQHDTLHCIVCGWTTDETCWIIDHQIFAGDTSQDVVWNNFSRWLAAEYPYADTGQRIKISAVAIDAGDGSRSQRVLDFAKPRKHAWACKGHSEVGSVWKPIITPTGLEKTRSTHYGPEMLGTNAAKQLFFDRLRIETGPGKIHFPAFFTNNHFEQLTAEHLKITVRGGYRSQRYVKRRASAANELLDCWLLSYVALRLLVERKGHSLQNYATKIAQTVGA